MALAKRRAEGGWKGTLEEGRGSFTVGRWMLDEVPVTWSSRTSPAEESTSPEELMAAAHASCATRRPSPWSCGNAARRRRA